MLTPPLEITAEAEKNARLVMRDVWRASELAISRAITGTTGHPQLDAELPNGGWPRSSLVELMVQQHGIGEMQLLRPFLSGLSQKQRVAMIQPPYVPHAMAGRAWGINVSNMMWLTPQSGADALWAAEQILKNGSCGAVLLWQSNVRPEALRRLNLAAQTTDTWLWLIRPLSAAHDPSPSPLRMSLRPALGGVSVDIIKRKGPHCDQVIFVPLPDMPAVRQPGVGPSEVAVPREPTIVAARNQVPVLI